MKYTALLVALLATIIRHYDYALFGLSAAVLAKTFMPPAEESEQLLNFFALFSIAVIVRPLGALVFGTIGDYYGRTRAIKIAAIFSLVATITIGFLPNFVEIGWYATITLIICRMLFFISLSGESDGVKLYLAENIAKSKVNLGNGLVVFFSQIGALTAAVSYHYSMTASDEAWRWNYILGGLCNLVFLVLRFFLKENYIPKSKISNNQNIYHLVKNNLSQFILSTIILGIGGGIYNFLVIFCGIFFSKVSGVISQHHARIINIEMISVYGVSALCAGLLSDRFDRRKIILISICLNISVGFITQFYLNDTEVVNKFLLIFIGCVPFCSVPLQMILQETFAKTIKMRIYSLAHSIGSMIVSSNVPLICMLIWHKTYSTNMIFLFYSGLLVVLLASIACFFKKMKPNNLESMVTRK